jgi:hypothetical protein
LLKSYWTLIDTLYGPAPAPGDAFSRSPRSTQRTYLPVEGAISISFACAICPFKTAATAAPRELPPGKRRVTPMVASDVGNDAAPAHDVIVWPAVALNA